MRINTYGRQYGWGLLRKLWFASLIHWMKNFAPISQPKPLTPKPITASRELVTRAFRCLDQTSAFDLISDGCRCYSTLARSRMSVGNMERFPYNRNFRKFGNSGKCYRNFSDKFPEIPKTVEFSKCDPFNWKFREKSWLERKLSGKFFEKFGYSSRGRPLFWNIFRCCSTRYWKLPKIHTGRFSWMEHAQGTFTNYKKFPENSVEK